ncbi:hypothetical protein EsH8_IX_000205 [Colletotrichum jinshuiense]
MKFTASTVLLALAAFSPLASAAQCSRTQDPDPSTGSGAQTYHYTVTATGVDDIPGRCGGLWDNLKRFGVCVASRTNCSGSGGRLSWSFTATVGCNGGMVESTWWEATRNNFGSIDCP